MVLAFVACSLTFAQDVRTNYMPAIDFSKFYTYAWVDEVQGVPSLGGHPDQILDAQVKQAIDSQMAAKGLKPCKELLGSIIGQLKDRRFFAVFTFS
jgi:hypothetical protein